VYTEGNVVIFNTKEDETEFSEWRNRHNVPNFDDDWTVAFIANVPVTNINDIVKVHSSPFRYLQGHKSYINETFYKVCSTDREALQNWLDKHGPFKRIEEVNYPSEVTFQKKEILPPEGFEQVRLREIADIRLGFMAKKSLTLSHSSPPDKYPEIYLLKAKDIQSDGNFGFNIIRTARSREDAIANVV
jgi:hypothetical protein